MKRSDMFNRLPSSLSDDFMRKLAKKYSGEEAKAPVARVAHPIWSISRDEDSTYINVAEEGDDASE